jgi:hypothetical protein
MPSPYYSVVPRNQKPYATPWFQRQYSDTQLSIEEELENAISQLVIENDISRVPSSDAIYKFLLTKLRSVVLTSDPNVFQEQNTFMEPIVSPANVDMINNANNNLIPNTTSIKNYLNTIISSLNEDIIGTIRTALTNSYSYTSTQPQTSFIITHNLNTTTITYNLLVKDELHNIYRNDMVSVSEIDDNNILIEATIPVNIKITIVAVVSI